MTNDWLILGLFVAALGFMGFAAFYNRRDRHARTSWMLYFMAVTGGSAALLFGVGVVTSAISGLLAYFDLWRFFIKTSWISWF